MKFERFSRASIFVFIKDKDKTRKILVKRVHYDKSHNRSVIFFNSEEIKKLGLTKGRYKLIWKDRYETHVVLVNWRNGLQMYFPSKISQFLKLNERRVLGLHFDTENDIVKLYLFDKKYDNLLYQLITS